MPSFFATTIKGSERMAGKKKIQGITIELGGDATGLNKALSEVNKKTTGMNKELKEVDRLLKFDPNNTVILAQKQGLLSDQISNTSDKLSALKQAQAQVEEQFKKGDIAEETYRKFQRELVSTEGSLQGLQGKLAGIQIEQDKVAESTKSLGNYFGATGKTVDDFSDVLGTRLTNAIKDGKATSAQLEQAIDKIGKSSLGASVDMDKFKNAIKGMDGSNNLDKVKKDLEKVGTEAQKAEKDVKSLDDKLGKLGAGVVAAGGVAGIVSQALEQSEIDVKIDIGFEVPEKSKAVIKQAAADLRAYGLDGEEALEGTRRLWALNTTATDEQRVAILKSAGAITKAYGDIDFKELIRDTDKIAGELKISQEEALGLVNTLLKTGFPPDQIDIIAEYGNQLTQAGYSAEEIQNLFKAGIDTKTWNIDNLMDGLKEARLQMAGYAAGLSDSQTEFLDGLDGMSAKRFTQLATAVSEGGEESTKALAELAKYIKEMEEGADKFELGTMFGATKYEDQGDNLFDTFINAAGGAADLKENMDALAESVDKLDDSSAVKMRGSIEDMKLALEPTMGIIADIVGNIAGWAKENPKLTATIVAITVAIGVISLAFMALTPIFTGVAAIFGVVATAIGTITAPIALAIAAIIAIIAIGVLLYKNWDEVLKGLKSAWQATASWFSGAFAKAGEVLSATWEGIKNIFIGIGEWLNELGVSIAEGFKTAIDNIVEIWTAIADGIRNAFEGMLQFIVDTMDAIREFILTSLTAVKDLFINIFTAIYTVTNEKWSAIREFVINTMQTVKDKTSAIIEKLKEIFVKIFTAIWETTKDKFNAVKDAIVNAIQKAKDLASSIVEKMKEVLTKVFTIIFDTGKEKFDSLKQAIVDAIQKAKDLAGDIANKMKEVISTAFSAIHDTGVKKFTDMKDTIVKVFTKLQDTIGGIVDTIKSFFTNLTFPEIKPPKIKLPRFSIAPKGWNVGDLLQGSIPKLGVEWYAKGGIMNSATAFGMNGNNVMVGGEAGSEAILPLNARNLAGIGKGIADQMQPMGEQHVSVVVNPAPVLLDGEQIAEVTFNDVGKKQYAQMGIKKIMRG